MNLDEYLMKMSDLDASDIFFAVGAPAMAQVNKRMVPIGEVLQPVDLDRLGEVLLSDPRAAGFGTKPDFDLARMIPGKGRFRLNVFRQRGDLGIVARRIKPGVPSLQSLGHPAILAQLSLERRGLLFVTGATGSGKSTTLAAMIDHRNASLDGHIVTIEDPIEFVHPHRKSIITQREVGVDTASYEDAIKSALRQAPDVVLIGEIRNRETAEAALHFAETGHLVMATLHSTNASQTLERVMNLFPEDAHAQIRMLLSQQLVGVVSQRLITTSDGKARVPAMEILLPSARVKDLIKAWDLGGVKAALAEAAASGMQSFDESLYRLVRSGKLTKDDATLYADSPSDFKLRFRMEEAKTMGAETKMRLQ